jgi:diguanylate cyclase (GGDEF)-like protein
MPVTPDRPPAETDLLATLRAHLEGLKRTRDGRTLHSLIERALERQGGAEGRLEDAFLDFLSNLLVRCAGDPKYGPVTRVKARLIQQRLALYRQGSGEAKPARTPGAPEPEASGTGGTEVLGPPPDAAPTTARLADEPPAVAAEEASPAPAEPVPPSAPEHARAEVDAARVVVEGLAEQVGDALAHDAELEQLEQSGQAVMNRLDTAIQDFSDLKGMLVRGLDELIREREQLQQKLSTTAGYLKSLEDDRNRLQAELSHARKHGQIDDVTGLPRREVFVRGLEAEIGRVRRYGFSMALALIDVDGLGRVNEEHGQDAGDAVLRTYASEIFGTFRAYDLVARYEDDSFAVLFPNTQKEGASRALEKARQRVSETMYTHAGRNLPLPSFSSVLTTHSPGEKAAALLARAAEALDRAKLQGPRQSVVALPAA